MSIRIQYQGQENVELCAAGALDTSRPVERFEFDAPVTKHCDADDLLVLDFLRRVPALNCLEIGIRYIDDDFGTYFKALILQATARFWKAFLENHEATTHLRKIGTIFPITPELLSNILQCCPGLEEMFISIVDSHEKSQRHEHHMWFWERLWHRLPEAWTSYQLVQSLRSLHALKRIEIAPCESLFTKAHFTELMLTGIRSLSLESLQFCLDISTTTREQVLSRIQVRCLILDQPRYNYGMDVTPVVYALRNNAYVEELVLKNVSLHESVDTTLLPYSSLGMDFHNGFNTTLRKLDISRVFVGRKPAAFYRPGQSTTPGEVLTLFHGLYNLKAGVQVIQYLSHFPALRQLALVPTPNSPGEDSQHPKVSQLDCRQLLQTLQTNANLVELIVTVQIGDNEWMQHLCQGLHENDTLQRLQLPYLRLAHVTMLDEALRRNRGLQALQIMLPEVKEDEAVAVLSSFFQGIAHWKRLETLNLCHYSTTNPTLLNATVYGLQNNDVLQQMSFSTPDKKYASHIQYYLTWNQCGRRLLRHEQKMCIPMGLWSHILAHAAIQPDPSILFSFLQLKQDLWSLHREQ